MNGVLEITKLNNRARLHQANHIIDVEVSRVPDTTYRFINIQLHMYCNLHVLFPRNVNYKSRK